MDFLIAKAEEQHADSFAECLDAVARERRFLTFLEGPPKPEVRKFVRQVVADRESQFFAVRDGMVAGWCDVIRKGRPSVAHSGVLGMGIRKEYRGKGLGRRLMEAALADADAQGLERVELHVFENNQHAIALYLKCGFKVEGKMEKFAKIDGVFYGALSMARLR